MSAVPPSAAASPGGAQTAPYAVRQINATITLGQGNFGASGSSAITIKSSDAIVGPRILLHVENVTIPSTGMMQCRIWGMTLDDMNAASVAGTQWTARDNTITIEAGDAISGMTTFYKGLIIEAYPDFKNQPDTSFFIQANAAIIQQMKPVPVTSFSGQAPAPQVFGALAQSAGVTLENNGVSTVLQSPYFHGTAWAQIHSALRAVDCFGTLDGVNNKLAVWPKNGSRAGGPIMISTATGMVGYPEFQQNQVRVRTLFNPNAFQGSGPGHQITIQSQLKAANGTFTISGATHDLGSQIPKGPWFTTYLATPVVSTGTGS